MRIPPGPYPCLLWVLQGERVLCGKSVPDQRFPTITVAGAHRELIHTRSAPGTSFFCVAFQPGALAWLTGLDLQPLTDTLYDALAWLAGRNDWTDWLHAMQQAPDHAERMALCDAFLSPRWHAVQQAESAWAQMLRHGWTRDARQNLATRLGCTMRHVQRRARALTGLRPGEVERMLRAEQALLAIRDADASVIDAALHHGYADQAHFSREARTLYEKPPAALRQHMKKDALDEDWLLRR